MKARPRYAEREVAKHLSFFFETLGLPAVERIPVLGRTGPDISINEFKLVVDVKSRQEVPKGIFTGKGEPFWNFSESWAGARLEEMGLLAERSAFDFWYVNDFVSVQRWMDHMHEWTQAQMPDGITALVLHRPGMNIKDSTFLIHIDHLEVFRDRYQHYRTLNQHPAVQGDPGAGEPDLCRSAN